MVGDRIPQATMQPAWRAAEMPDAPLKGVRLIGEDMV